MYLASVVNLGMIWCFGFFFLESLDGFDEETNNETMRVDFQKLGSIPTPCMGSTMYVLNHFPVLLEKQESILLLTCGNFLECIVYILINLHILTP